MLARSIVPQELLSEPVSTGDKLLTQVIDDYIAIAPAVTSSDSILLTTIKTNKPIPVVHSSRVCIRLAGLIVNTP